MNFLSSRWAKATHCKGDHAGANRKPLALQERPCSLHRCRQLPLSARQTLTMQSQRQRAKHAAATAERQHAHVDRRACFSGIGPSRCMPRDVQALAAAISTRTLPGLVDRHGNPRLGRVVTTVGHAGDDFERARRMVAKGMPHTELTDVYGVSRAPHMNGDVRE